MQIGKPIIAPFNIYYNISLLIESILIAGT